MKNQQKKPLMNKRQLQALGLSIFILIISGGYFYFRYEKNTIRQEQYSYLKTVSDMKIDQIMQWQKERIADAHVVAEGPFFRQNFQRWIISKDNTLENNILERLSLLKHYFNYENVFVVSAEGKLLISIDTTFKHFDPLTLDFCNKALREREIIFSNLYFCKAHNTIHFDILSPVLDDRNVPLAVIVLRVNPYDYLYPLIQSWPTNSKSAETLIIRKDGDGVLFINELRHRSNTALKLRIPLTSLDVPAVKAILGNVGICEGTDYRGVEVLSDIRPVPGTNWYMIAKIDRSEIYAELRYRVIIIVIITLILLLLIGAGIAWLYDNRQKNIYRQLLETGTALQESQEEYRATLYSIGDAVITTDVKGSIRNMNVVAEKLTAWKEADAAGRSIGDVFHIVNQESRDKVENPVQMVIKEGLVTGLANHSLLISKDGKEIPIADSFAPIRNEKGEITGVVLVFRDQSEEQAAQKALTNSEIRYRRLFEAARDGILILDADTAMVVDVNPFLVEMLGYSREKFFEKTIWELGFFKDIAANKSNFKELLQKEFIRYENLPFETAKGQLINVEFVSNVYQVDNQKVIQCNIRDITERKRAEKEITSLTLRQQAILAAVPDIIMEVDNNKIYTWANKSGTDFFGSDVLGKEASSYFEGSQDTYDIVHPLFKGDENTIYVESWQRRKDGEKRLLAWWCRALKDENGNVTGAISSASDITGRYLAEIALIESERKFREIIVNLDEGFYSVTLDGILLEHNQAFCRIMGFDESENLNGMRLPDFWQVTEERQDYLKALTEKDSISNYQVNAKTQTGEKITVLASAHFVKDKDKNPLRIEGIFLDITGRIQAEEEIRKLNIELEDRVAKRTAQLEASNQELEAFSYSVSHDLRAPLRHINGYVDLLSKQFTDALPAKGKHYLHTIADSANQMGVLIDDLLKFSRAGRQEMKRSDIEMNAVLMEAIEPIKQENPKRKIEWIIADLPLINGDYSLLKLVWINLLNNAVKFTQKKEKALIEIGFQEKDGEYIFFVKDNGAGFDMKYAHKLFGVFQRLHPAEEYEGTGIGLANVQRIILRHGGRTWAEAEPGKGAAFYFTLQKN